MPFGVVGLAVARNHLLDGGSDPQKGTFFGGGNWAMQCIMHRDNTATAVHKHPATRQFLKLLWDFFPDTSVLG